MSHPQLTLPIKLLEEANWDNFYVSQANQQLISLLKSQPSDRFFAGFIYGVKGSGRSHVLQALSQGEGCFYLPLSIVHQAPPQAILEGIDHCHLITIDDIEVIAGNKAWEEALFHLYNRCKDFNKHIMVSSIYAPQQLPLHLADLVSRLQAGLVKPLHTLSDEDLAQLLSLRARNRGLNISPEVQAFIMQRCLRDGQSLIDLLNRLDEASYQTKRALTKPFVKEVMGW